MIAEYLPAISKLIVTSLLALFVIIIGYQLLSQVQRLFHKPMLSYPVFVFVLLIFVLTTLFILDWRSGVAQLEIAHYFVLERIFSELVISGLLVISFIGTQIIINWVQSARMARVLYLNRPSSFNQILVQWDAGKVSDTKVKREQTLHSLLKWIKMENEAGWYELKEQLAGKLTDMPASWIVLKELNIIQQQKTKNSMSVRNHNYEKRLESLIDIEPVGVVWQKWDDDLVTEDIAYEALEVNAFKKWILNKDETGWIDLDYIRQDRKSLAPKVVEIAKYELQEIENMKDKEEEIDFVLKTRLEKIVLV